MQTQSPQEREKEIVRKKKAPLKTPQYQQEAANNITDAEYNGKHLW